MRTIVLIALILAAAPFSQAETVRRGLDIEVESEIFATMGEVAVTHADFDAFLEQRPPGDVTGNMFSLNNLERILDLLIGDRLLAQAGIEAGLLDDERVQAGLLDAGYKYLAGRHMQEYLEARELEDYGQQARELWLTMDNRPEHPPRFDFTHLLVSITDRSDAEAARIVLELHDRLEAGESIDGLITDYSEDPSMEDNRGRYLKVQVDELDAEFARALQQLNEPGEISEPVRSAHGWHIIRLDARYEAHPKTFEEALPELEAAARARHRERLQKNYLSSLTTEPIEIAEDAVRKLRERHGFVRDQVDE